MGEVSLSFFSILLDFFNGKLDKYHSLLLCLLRLSIYKYRPFHKKSRREISFQRNSFGNKGRKYYFCK